MQSEEYPLKPSANFQSHQLPLGGSSWLNATKEVERFLNLTLSLIHPDLLKPGVLMLDELRALEMAISLYRDSDNQQLYNPWAP